MSAPTAAPEKTFRSYVPENTTMAEFTVRAVLLGLVMTVILGAANAYLGLRAGMTIAATYPAAVIGMAVLRLMKGSILEENIARTVGSIGESVAAGAIFTIPAFVISGAWPVFDFEHAYWKSSILMLVGGTLGILFVTLLRRVMVEDPELPFPESVAASQIHIAGQQGSRAAKILFGNMGFGGLVYLLGQFNLFNASKDFIVNVGNLGTSFVRMGRSATAPKLPAGAVTTISAPAISPAYLGVGYIIGPRLASLNFAGGVIAWGLLVPLILFLGGPTFVAQFVPAGTTPDTAFWAGQAGAVWSFIVRPIAVGGMLVGACYTLFRMRKSLGSGMARAVSDLKKSAAAHAGTARTERDINAKYVFGGLLVVLLSMIFLYRSYADSWTAGIVAADRDDHRRLLLRRRLGKPGRPDRLVEQPDLRTDAGDADHRGAADGADRRLRHSRRRCGAGSGGRGLRFVGGRGRDAAGPESRTHPRRHSQQDADRRLHGRGGRQLRAVPDPHAAQPGQHQRRRHRIRRPSVVGAAGRTDGHAVARHRRRRNGMAADRGRHPDGHSR